MTEQITIIALIATVVLLGTWDIYVVLTRQKTATISAVIHGAATRRPIIAFALGVLIGHVFWPL